MVQLNIDYKNRITIDHTSDIIGSSYDLDEKRLEVTCNIFWPTEVVNHWIEALWKGQEMFEITQGSKVFGKIRLWLSSVAGVYGKHWKI